MSINITGTKRVGELPISPILMTNNIPHESGTNLGQASVQQLADLIKDYIGTSSSLAFNPTTVTDGGTLPATTSNEWMLVGKGTFNNVGGGEQIICTEELSAITSNGSFWSISVEIPINVELAGIVQNIRSGYVNTVPSEDAVFNALVEKIGDVSDNKIYARTQGSWVEIDLSTSSIEVDDFEYTTGLQQFNLSNTASQILSVSVNGWSTENYTVINSDTILINDVIGMGQQVVIRYLTDLTTGISPYYTKLQTDAIASNKVDKVVGFGLSKNDFTDVLKAKLDSITAIFTTTLKTTYDNTATALTNLLATGSRLITTGEITKLSNITGTNTGDQDLSGLAPKISPVLTGTPTAPTAIAGTNTNQIATTAFVTTANSETVKTTGNQTISGTKTFSSPVIIPNGVNPNEGVNIGQLNAFVPSGTVNLTGTQTINGIKSFLLPISFPLQSFASTSTEARIGNQNGHITFASSKTSASSDDVLKISTLNVSKIGGVLLNVQNIDGTIALTNNPTAISATQFRLSLLNTAPSSATDTGVLGEIRVTSTYIYVCIATNIWVRTSLSTW